MQFHVIPESLVLPPGGRARVRVVNAGSRTARARVRDPSNEAFALVSGPQCSSPLVPGAAFTFTVLCDPHKADASTAARVLVQTPDGDIILPLRCSHTASVSSKLHLSCSRFEFSPSSKRKKRFSVSLLSRKGYGDCATSFPPSVYFEAHVSPHGAFTAFLDEPQEAEAAAKAEDHTQYYTPSNDQCVVSSSSGQIEFLAEDLCSHSAELVVRAVHCDSGSCVASSRATLLGNSAFHPPSNQQKTERQSPTSSQQKQKRCQDTFSGKHTLHASINSQSHDLPTNDAYTTAGKKDKQREQPLSTYTWFSLLQLPTANSPSWKDESVIGSVQGRKCNWQDAFQSQLREAREWQHKRAREPGAYGVGRQRLGESEWQRISHQQMEEEKARMQNYATALRSRATTCVSKGAARGRIRPAAQEQHSRDIDEMTANGRDAGPNDGWQARQFYLQRFKTAGRIVIVQARARKRCERLQRAFNKGGALHEDINEYHEQVISTLDSFPDASSRAQQLRWTTNQSTGLGGYEEAAESGGDVLTDDRSRLVHEVHSLADLTDNLSIPDKPQVQEANPLDLLLQGYEELNHTRTEFLFPSYPCHQPDLANANLPSIDRMPSYLEQQQPDPRLPWPLPVGEKPSRKSELARKAEDGELGVRRHQEHFKWHPENELEPPHEPEFGRHDGFLVPPTPVEQSAVPDTAATEEPSANTSSALVGDPAFKLRPTFGDTSVRPTLSTDGTLPTEHLVTDVHEPDFSDCRTIGTTSAGNIAADDVTRHWFEWREARVTDKAPTDKKVDQQEGVLQRAAEDSWNRLIDHRLAKVKSLTTNTAMRIAAV